MKSEYVRKKFPGEQLRRLLGDDVGKEEDLEVVRDEIIDNTRWSIVSELTFRHGENYYQTTYSRGATEYQDEKPFQDEKEVNCYQVVPKEVVTVEYVPIKNT